jgi:hypothetical protein
MHLPLWNHLFAGRIAADALSLPRLRDEPASEIHERDEGEGGRTRKNQARPWEPDIKRPHSSCTQAAASALVGPSMRCIVRTILSRPKYRLLQAGRAPQCACSILLRLFELQKQHGVPGRSP